MTRTFLLVTVGAIWAFLMAELVKREVLPYYEYQASPSYRTMLQEREHPVLERWSVWMGQERVGESETLFEPGPAGGRIRTRAIYEDARKFLPPSMAGMVHAKVPVEIWSDVRVDPGYQLSEIELKFRALAVATARGVRRGGTLSISYELPVLGRGGQSVELPRDGTLADAALPMHGVGRLRLNKKWRLNTIDLDPLEGLKIRPLFAVVEEKELRSWKGEMIEVFRVDVKKKPNEDTTPEYQMWVNEEGQVLEQRQYKGMQEMKAILEEIRTIDRDAAAAWTWAPPEGK